MRTNPSRTRLEPWLILLAFAIGAWALCEAVSWGAVDWFVVWLMRGRA